MFRKGSTHLPEGRAAPPGRVVGQVAAELPEAMMVQTIEDGFAAGRREGSLSAT